ncbi:MAG TPA: hypothetical protein VFR93_00890, partial [Candidatus Limnocylindrales bacterium]|nr:hypothetical protein [Candidatus Limnocylindrales bacterium]
ITLGRAEEGLASVRAMESMFGPAQVLGYRVGAKAWEVAALHLLGRWDEAIAAGRRLVELWVEYDRASVGYAAHAFVRVLEIVRARRETGLEMEFAAAARELLRQFDETRNVGRLHAMVEGEYEQARPWFVDAWPGFTARLDMVEIALGVLADRALPAGEQVRSLIEHASRLGVRTVEAQARRALGVEASDAEQLARAIELYEAMAFAPNLARARADLALLTGDSALFDQASAALERLGDVAHLERLAARRAGRGGAGAA